VNIINSNSLWFGGLESSILNLLLQADEFG
jgi:hypothetical protein